MLQFLSPTFDECLVQFSKEAEQTIIGLMGKPTRTDLAAACAVVSDMCTESHKSTSLRIKSAFKDQLPL